MRPQMSRIAMAGLLVLAVTAGCTPATAARDGAVAQSGVAESGVVQAGTARTGPAAAQAEAAAHAEVAAKSAPYCGITWGSSAKSRSPMSIAALVKVDTSRQSCWDRVVFEFDGAVHGYSVRYTDRVLTDGEGLNLSPYTAGGAWLEVVLRAPAYNESGATYHARTGAHAANVVRYSTLRDVVFGGSFEGSSTFAVGVRARLPFRVSVASGPGSHSRIIVDVAHRWQ